MKTIAQSFLALSLVLFMLIAHAEPTGDEFLKQADAAMLARDFAGALQYAKKAAEKGNPYAYPLLGEMFKSGLGVERDLKQSFFGLTKDFKPEQRGACYLWLWRITTVEGLSAINKKRLLWWS